MPQRRSLMEQIDSVMVCMTSGGGVELHPEVWMNVLADLLHVRGAGEQEIGVDVLDCLKV